jgi:hypothetical protein
MLIHYLLIKNSSSDNLKPQLLRLGIAGIETGTSRVKFQQDMLFKIITVIIHYGTAASKPMEDGFSSNSGNY